MDDILKLIGRKTALFNEDFRKHEEFIMDVAKGLSFLVIGGAGSIGQAVVKEIFKLKPGKLHVVDISENNLVELVRDLRSSLGYIEGDFRTFAVDCGSLLFEALLAAEGPYDYFLNLSALKHVRSEKDPYTLMRMVEVNIINTESTARAAEAGGARKYFGVSTDKAANPVNMMGASKQIMELFLMRRSLGLPVSTARFANVAFSDGSLLCGFNRRMQKGQPLSAPRDVKRYFITPEESGKLCLLSCLLGENRDIFFPKLSAGLHPVTFAEIAVSYLKQLGYEAEPCETEEEARCSVQELRARNRWPCYFFDSDTTGEKQIEEFFMAGESLDLERFEDVGVIKKEALFDEGVLDAFTEAIEAMKRRGNWSRAELVNLFKTTLPCFDHLETKKSPHWLC